MNFLTIISILTSILILTLSTIYILIKLGYINLQTIINKYFKKKKISLFKRNFSELAIDSDDDEDDEDKIEENDSKTTKKNKPTIKNLPFHEIKKIDTDKFISIEEMHKKHDNLLDMLKHRVKTHPNRICFVWVDDNGEEEIRITYKQLYNLSLNFAKQNLQKYKGQKALLLFPPGLEYAFAFYSCLFAGVICVPLIPPKDFQDNITEGIEKILKVAQDCNAKVVISTNQIHYKLSYFSLIGSFKVTKFLKDFNWIKLSKTSDLIKNYENNNNTDNVEEMIHKPKPSDVAYLQYTSGSTSAPKGVMITHKNLEKIMITQGQGLLPYYGHDKDSKWFTACVWLPPFHDFGLIFSILSPPSYGATYVLFSPLTFINKPIIWLKTLYKYQSLFTCCPNFALEIMCNSITDKQVLKYPMHKKLTFGLGAEPILPKTIRKFKKKFGCENLCGGFAQAESTLATCIALDRKIRIVKLDRNSFEKGKVKIFNESKENEENGEDKKCGDKKNKDFVEIFNCGEKLSGLDLKIVNPNTKIECEIDEIGELYIKGETVAKGYLGLDEKTKETFNNFYYFKDKNNNNKLIKSKSEYLSSGDQFFKIKEKNGKEIYYICGRLKDMIIIRGRNYYPHDIEKVVTDSNKFLIDHGCIAFGVSGLNGSQEEKLVIVAEIDDEHDNENEIKKIFKNINKEISSLFNIKVSQIVLIKEDTLPRTATRKVSRMPCKKAYLKGELKIVKTDN